MPVLKYFAVTAPVLLAVLLVLSTYLDPTGSQASSTVFGMGVGRANTERADAWPRIGPSESTRLKARPLGR